MEGIKTKSLDRWEMAMSFGAKLGCHQMPERSFFINGFQFFVCARCSGVILGQLIGIVTYIFIKPSFLLSLLLLIPMGIDWGLQYLTIITSTNLRRLITGILGGVGLTYLYIKFFLFIIKLVRDLLL